MSTVLFRAVEVDGALVDVLVEDGVVRAIGRRPAPDDVPAEIVDGAGGALLPGLHDHHVHLLALAARPSSVDVTGAAGFDGLAGALRRGPVVGGWIRATGYHESIAGDLDRRALDRLIPDVPVRVQHRSGALWMLNSAALERVAGALDRSPDVERDDAGRPVGRLWRYDARLRPALPDAPPDLAPVGRLLAELGITGVTDATPDLEPDALNLLTVAHARGDLPQRVTLLGAPTGTALPPGFVVGPRKLLLRDHDLPSYDELAALVRAAHAEDRAVAVHCVTRHSLVLTLAVLEEVGVQPGDRIEHASVTPPDVAAWLARLGVAVVTQPDFLRTRGREYQRDVDPADLPHLYPYAGLHTAGVAACAASDAPYGGIDPWQVIATAADRPLGPAENVTASVALNGYLSPPLDPGGRRRRIEPGATADLVLLTKGLEQALRAPSAALVRSVWIAGRRVTPRTPPTGSGHLMGEPRGSTVASDG